MTAAIIEGMPGAPPSVGQTVHCSQPVVTGGVGPFQYDYMWTENNEIIFESRFLTNTLLLTNEEAGKVMACIVNVTDKGAPSSQSISVKSNTVGPILPAELSEGVELACVAQPTFSASDGLKEGSILHRLTSGHCNIGMEEYRYFWMACEAGHDQSDPGRWSSRWSDEDYKVGSYDVSKGHSFKLEQRWQRTDSEGNYQSISCNSAVLDP